MKIARPRITILMRVLVCTLVVFLGLGWLTKPVMAEPTGASDTSGASCTVPDGGAKSYMVSFDINRPGANHDAIVDAYNDGWWVWGSPIHDENWELKSFDVDVNLHIDGQTEPKTGKMTMTVNPDAADPWNQKIWNGKVPFGGIEIPYDSLDVEYYEADGGGLIEPHLLSYDFYLKNDSDRGKAVLSVPKLENTVFAYDEGEENVYKDVILVENVKIEEKESGVYLDGANGDDSRDGLTAATAVKSFNHAKELAATNTEIRQIIVVGATPIEGEISLDGTNASLVRGEGFNGYLLQVKQGAEATLKNIVIDGNSSKNENIEKSLIELKNKSTLNINEGAALCNNKLKTVNGGDARNGGAIYANGATVNMSDGLIENNVANNGGGIFLGRSTMNFTGGVIRGNTAERVHDGAGYKTSGGGITADQGSTLNMSGKALVEKNHSDEVGGGISLGSMEWGATNTLNMSGGTVSENTSGATGGGIFIQAKYFSGGASKAYITAGNIVNNQMLGNGYTNKAFGGGGIYVNGANNMHGVNGANGELYLTNALITDNTSTLEGGGYASCPISKTTVHVNDGVGLYGNKRERDTDAARELYVLASYAYGLHSGDPSYELSKRMLGGVPNNWLDGNAKRLDDDKYIGTLNGASGENLSLHTESVGNELTKQLAKVIIKGNTSATRGGGIGSNGSVTFGTPGDTAKVEVTKTWDDADDQDKKRPESIDVNLVAKIIDPITQEVIATGVVETRTLNAGNSWTTIFEDLPTKSSKRIDNGDHHASIESDDAIDGSDVYDIEYSIEEKSVPRDYTVHISTYFGKDADNNYTFTLKNSYTPEKVDVPVRKVWTDGDNQDGKRPGSVTVQLLADGKAVDGRVLTLNSGNDWDGSFNGLPKYRDGNLITYTIKEVGVPEGYTSAVSGDADKGFMVTNTYTPETVDISGRKAWDDADNQDGKRPESITVRLFADNVEAQSVTVTKADWSWKFVGLPKYRDGGKLITYTISEDVVADYTPTVTGYDVKNTYTPEKTRVPVRKVWNDRDDQDGKRPGSITVQLFADGEAVDGRVLTLNSGNAWAGSFDGLAKYRDGKLIAYTIKEAGVPSGYKSVVSGDAVQGFTVTNSRTPENPPSSTPPTVPPTSTPPTVPPTVPPSSTPPTAPSTSTPPQDPKTPRQLARTGVDVAEALSGGILLFWIGALFLIARKRRS